MKRTILTAFLLFSLSACFAQEKTPIVPPPQEVPAPPDTLAIISLIDVDEVLKMLGAQVSHDAYTIIEQGYKTLKLLAIERYKKQHQVQAPPAKK